MTSPDPTIVLLAVGGLAGVFGLVIGSFLNVVAYRVPAGISLLRDSRCPRCDAPVRWWQNVPVVSWVALRGRCGSCRTPISRRYPLVEALTGLLFAGLALGWFVATDRMHATASVALPSITSFDDALAAFGTADGYAGPLVAQLCVLGAYLWFVAAGVVQTLIDLDTRRLPHVITDTSLLVMIGLLVAACALGADWWALARAGAGLLVLYVFYGIIRLIRPDGMGGGDVRLAALVGLALGWLGWGALIVGGFAAFVLGGLFGIALLFSRRAGRRSAIPFGPWMILGSWLGIAVGNAIGDWYVTLLGVR